jgi:hypothetical protein
MLLESRLILEALVLANTISEVMVLAAFTAAVRDDGRHDAVEKLGHSIRLQLLEEFVVHSPEYYRSRRKAMWQAADKLYKPRNGYVHALVMPDEDRCLDYHKQGSLIKSFSDVFQQDQWLDRLRDIAAGAEPIEAAIVELTDRRGQREDEPTVGWYLNYSRV